MYEYYSLRKSKNLIHYFILKKTSFKRKKQPKERINTEKKK